MNPDRYLIDTRRGLFFQTGNRPDTLVANSSRLDRRIAAAAVRRAARKAAKGGGK